MNTVYRHTYISTLLFVLLYRYAPQREVANRGAVNQRPCTQNNKIGGDSWGVEFGVDDLAMAYIGESSLKKSPSLDVGLWFDYNTVFLGFTITPGFGVGADFGGVVFAGTVVDGD